MGNRLDKVLNWSGRAQNAAGLIQWLITAATASGIATSAAMLWQQLPWYQALTYGVVIVAALVTLVAGLDYLWRTHSLRSKIAVTEVLAQHAAYSPDRKKVAVVLVAYVQNQAERPIWYKLESIHCHIDKTTHDPAPRMLEPLEIPAGGRGGIPIPAILDLDASKHEFGGRLEVAFKYGPKKDRLNLPYKTNGQMKVYVYPNQLGIPMVVVIPTGATASYD